MLRPHILKSLDSVLRSLFTGRIASVRESALLASLVGIAMLIVIRRIP
jgi:uncharacterized membrane protein